MFWTAWPEAPLTKLSIAEKITTLSLILVFNSFLNPSIKNLMPNPNSLLDMEKSSLRTLEVIKNNYDVLIDASAFFINILYIYL